MSKLKRAFPYIAIAAPLVLIALFFIGVNYIGHYLSDRFGDVDLSYTIINTSNEQIRYTELVDYHNYADISELLVRPANMLAPGQERANITGTCLYILDANNQEQRSINLTYNFKDITQLEDGQQRRIDLTQEHTPCPNGALTEFSCLIGGGKDIERVEPLESCFNN